MRLSVILILFFLSAQVFAQQLTGIVTDKATRLPIANATVKTALLTVFTSTTGKFNLTNVTPGDTIRISCIGYKPYYLISGTINRDTVHVYLDKNSILLNDVIIKSTIDYKTDSIKKRRQYANMFNYRAPTFKDIFIKRSPNSNNNIPNSTASIMGINVLQLVGLLNKNNAPASRIQKVLLTDEADNYIDHVFSKSRVSAATSLKGDSLLDFMIRYRPSVQKMKSMSDYDITLYIKNNYKEFIKTYKHDNHAPFN